MDAEEREIYYYLKGYGREFISAREICRRAGGKHKYRESPDWAKPALARMVERGILETDFSGHYRLKARERNDKKQKWVSPQIAKILEKSGKDFGDTVVVDQDMDQYYESL